MRAHSTLINILLYYYMILSFISYAVAIKFHAIPWIFIFGILLIIANEIFSNMIIWTDKFKTPLQSCIYLKRHPNEIPANTIIAFIMLLLICACCSIQ